MPQDTAEFKFMLCDVFATQAYSGNSLAVFMDNEALSSEQMLTMTQELRHFESIFISEENGRLQARIYDLFEELPFAGHPIIGAACCLHQRAGIDWAQSWTFDLVGGRSVTVKTIYEGGHYIGTLDQGRPDFLSTIADSAKEEIAEAFNLRLDDISSLPLEVISTGLKYLVVPVTGGLETARITISDLEEKLAHFGAEFAYLVDVNRFAGRHWNNDGIVEDIATGSAAGVVGAYALRHGLVQSETPFILRQGHFIGRPSEIRIEAFGTFQDVTKVTVSGAVAFVGRGEIVAP